MRATQQRRLGGRGRFARLWTYPAGFLLVVAAATALALPSPALATSSCWQRVILDWSKDGRIDGTYPLTCYRAAVTHLPEDLRTYSSAPDDIDRALMQRRASSARALAAPSQPVAAASDGGRSRLTTLLPGVAGMLAAVGAVLWVLRARRRQRSL